MISRLTGVLIEKQPPQIVIDVQGVGYEVDVSMQTFYALPAVGEKVQLFTQLIVREDAHLLFGFADKTERTTFRQLVKVSGIGAKTALGILSAMTADELAQAIAQEDVKRLSSAPGIGKKTAERMVLELRGKLVHSDGADLSLFTAAAPADESEDIVSTLLALGYSEREARAAIKGIPAGTDVSEGVRLALKHLLK
ncbi:Holliday junction branch migration protein RuvA [Kingella negevensis]|uniref:Holliday junction branch migration protein RuvA n=1 Tax=Kingella negevensis TaxID=1522312 RepID=UPI00254AEC8C|nr:Holliday junction branch migration protein RuvA [Kingella negevensis]MDK4679289.1 Holliday junction branch migration protein RuvA [Kingella negevensis]MDK4682989.1 Holliday junction branch migration protein RuvA [Kingella negevensis]MDK4691189.1 Holliday junction branch migration protein RuvA [Kingella negevensis]MDK4693663.1 Holliday junction branch migration protein RuvA [Kingella negevensis]MDK4700479.1 Holliday junction branch migration protein RuvA [Kingella negevensis]